MLFPRLHMPDERVALHLGDVALTYAALSAAVSRHLAWLRSLGVAPGDRLAVWTAPCIDTVVALVAHACGGMVSVPLNPAAGERELAHVLTDARPRLVVYAAGDRSRGAAPADDPVTTPPRSDAALAPAPAEAPPEVLERAAAAAGLPVVATATGCRHVDRTPERNATAPGMAWPPPVRAVDDAPLLVLYTSGTTGPPKGAVITRRNVASNLDALALAWAWTEHDVVVHALPLFHVHGLVLGLFGSLRRGGALRWLHRFEPRSVAQALAADPGRSVLFAVPTMVHRLAEAACVDPRVRDGLRAARLLVSGSAALPVRDHAQLEAACGRHVVERYGLTETLIVTAMRHDEPPSPGRVGRPLEGVEVRLVDEARRPLEGDLPPEGTDVAWESPVGEVAVRGPGVFAGYLGRPDATAAVRDAEGWFYTGDLATRDAKGSLRIVGRRSTDLIKSGGFKVGAGEVEAALLEDERVAECAVVGVPDEDLGERIVAFVVPRDPGAPPTLDDLAARVAGTLAPHKRPRELHLRDALPRNAMGKVQKRRLLEE